MSLQSIAITYPYRFLRLNQNNCVALNLLTEYDNFLFLQVFRLNPKSLNGPKHPYITWQFCIPTSLRANTYRSKINEWPVKSLKSIATLSPTDFPRLNPKSLCGVQVLTEYSNFVSYRFSKTKS